MDIQSLVVILIALVVAGIVIRKLYRFFFVKNDTPYCGGCTGCDAAKKIPKKNK